MVGFVVVGFGLFLCFGFVNLVWSGMRRGLGVFVLCGWGLVFTLGWLGEWFVLVDWI